MSRPERKLEIDRLRREGATAFASGRSIHTIPGSYTGTMNEHHWRLGYIEAKEYAKSKYTMLERIDNAESIEDVKTVLRDMYFQLDLEKE